MQRSLPAAVAAAVLVLAGCGGGGGSTAASTGATSASASSSYRWEVPTSGAPPSIAQENRATGTTAWRLPGPRDLLGGAAHGDIEGYVAAQAILPGQVERIYVSAPHARHVRISVYRMGWYGGTGGRLVLRSGSLRAVRQPPCTHDSHTGLTECDWHPTLSFAIPPALPSGVYIAKMTAGRRAGSDAIFIVRAAHPGPLIAELPTATWEAYNAWGGDSLYPGGTRIVGVTGTNQGVAVSYDRPYDSQTGAGQFFIREVAAVRFLERYGYPVSYTTIESIDTDPGQLHGARAVMDVGHSEYWSQGDYDALETARDGGTSLIFLSSDTMAWRVRFDPASPVSSEAGTPGHVIVAYKEHVALDPDSAQSTGIFPGGGAALTGSAYNGCITARVVQPGPPVYRYFPWAPSPALRPAWLFAGSGVTASTQIAAITGYELDQRTAATPAGTTLIGAGGPVPCQSDAEPSPAHGTVAETTLYTAPSGALVFATGTLGWLYGLYPVPQASPDVPRAPVPQIVAITRNLLARVLGGATSAP